MVLEMPEEHVYQLSSIDHSVVRTYVPYCLCFPCEKSRTEFATNKLSIAVRRAVTHFPILAGTVGPARGSQDERQASCYEVSLTLNQLENFRPSVKELSETEFSHTWADLVTKEMPPMALISSFLTPLPEEPEAETLPAFAVQANFIPGGLIVSLFLHHSITDIFGITAVTRQMSDCLPSKRLTDQDLRENAWQYSRLRDRFSWFCEVAADIGHHIEYEKQYTDEEMVSRIIYQSGSRRIMAFDSQLIQETRTLINTRHKFLDVNKNESTRFSEFECLAAIL